MCDIRANENAKTQKSQVVLASALAECFLKKMRKSNYIRYEDGADNFTLAKDEEEDDAGSMAVGGSTPVVGGEGSSSLLAPLKKPDPKLERRLEKIRDLVLFRYGSTGVYDAIKKAVTMRGTTH